MSIRLPLSLLASVFVLGAQLFIQTSCSGGPTCDSSKATCESISTCEDSCGNKGSAAKACAAKACNANGSATDTCGNVDMSCGHSSCDASTATCTSAATCTDSCGNIGAAATACSAMQCNSNGSATDSCGNADSSCPCSAGATATCTSASNCTDSCGNTGVNASSCASQVCNSDGSATDSCGNADTNCPASSSCTGLNNCVCTDGTCATTAGYCDDGFECRPCTGGCICNDGTCATSSGSCDDGTECSVCPHLPSSCINSSGAVDPTDCPCIAGMTCNGSGVCTPIGCTSSADCAPGWTCGSSNVCTSPIYAEAPRNPGSRHHQTVTLGSQVPVKIPFQWHDAAGIPAPADLALEVDGHPVLQVSSVGSRPFVRAGLDVTLLTADVRYFLVLTQSEHAMTMKIVRADNGAVAFHAVTPSSSKADVVLPEPYMRPAVTLEVAQ